ncbi:MAG: hypothetical protein WB698_01770 [Solirubrobacteraceae bacterium]
MDDQALEERQIELPAHPVGGFVVGALAVPGSGQGLVQIRLGCPEVSGDGGQPAFGGGGSRREAILLALEQIERDRVGIVGLEQLLALTLELAQSALLHTPLTLGVAAELRELLTQEGPQPDDLILGELHGRVVSDDGSLHPLDPRRSELAACRVTLPSTTDEVRIGAAVALSMVDDQASAALAAVDAALQVVRVLPILLAGQILSAQQLLNFMPNLWRDERLMLPGIHHASITHHAHVVRIAQQRVQMRDDQRPTRILAARRRRQATYGQLG